MENRWSEQEAAEVVERYGARHGEALALRTYSSRLIGAEPALVLHGGGNTSVKGWVVDVFGERLDALFVKASGHDLAQIEPEGHVAVDLNHLRRLRELPELSDRAIRNELRTNLFDAVASSPSIEAPVHALLPGRYVDHTHADAVLALTNQPEGEAQIQQALGDEVLVLPYLIAGFQLAKQVGAAVERHPETRAMVWMRHGIVTWGETARESYERMIELVSRAEDYLERRAQHPLQVSSRTSLETARQRLQQVAPIARGLLAVPTGDPDWPIRRVVLSPLVTREVLDVVDSEGGRALCLSAPLTADHLIRTKPTPAWVELEDFADADGVRRRLTQGIEEFGSAYCGYLERHAERMPVGVMAFDPLPRVILLPGLGALCAGPDAQAARVARDITAHTLRAKARIAAMHSVFQGLEEAHLFDMEYRVLQHAKLDAQDAPPLAGHVILVTGAAGAIGSGICTRLLQEGGHLAVTDLPGSELEELVSALSSRFPERVIGIPLDVTDAASVVAGFEAVSCSWGGVDQVVINAGLAHVAGLEELEIERYQRVQRVNTEGTLLLLQQAARHLKRQASGGDVVLISTKNVFAPGARFGAYSATKAAAHQLARVASLELAELDVRVNMVSPDAVFSHGERRSGLWAEVGPDRMRARGLDAQGLEEYYRDRNLLKARISADHVARAVLFFLSRQTPTTGATIPVDGGLPDSTPR